MNQRNGPVSSPALRRRSMRQRRMTAGGKAAPAKGGEAPAPPAAPPSEQPPPQQQQQEAEEAQVPLHLQVLQRHMLATGEFQPPEALEAAWRQYLCPGRDALWEFAKTVLPGPSLWAVQHLHPAIVYPDFYPHQLPPGLEFLPTLQLPPTLPVLRPAAPQQQQLPNRQPAAAPPALAAAAAVAPPAAAAAAANDASEEEDEEELEGCCYPDASDTLAFCWCSDCRAGFTSSPDSELVQPGKRIKWRGAIYPEDPVRRNLFDALKREGEAAPVAAAGPAPATLVPAAGAGPAAQTRSQRQPRGVAKQ